MLLHTYPKWLAFNLKTPGSVAPPKVGEKLPQHPRRYCVLEEEALRSLPALKAQAGCENSEERDASLTSPTHGASDSVVFRGLQLPSEYLADTWPRWRSLWGYFHDCVSATTCTLCGSSTAGFTAAP